MIQELGAVQPIKWDTALAESERADGGKLQRVPHLWLMWGNDQDDRPFVLASLHRVTTRRPDQEEEIEECATNDRYFAS